MNVIYTLIKILGGTIIIFPAFSADLSLDFALSDARKNCAGIHAKLKGIRNLTGVNTGVTGVGTVAGGGALYAGIKKHQQDQIADKLKELLDKFNENSTDEETFEILVYLAEYKHLSDLDKAYEDATKKSKTLGNVRTGLLATNTATNIAGIIIASKNQSDNKDVIDMAKDCLSSVKLLERVTMQARIDGSTDIETLNGIQKIINSCGRHNISQIEKVSKHTGVVQVSTAVGIGTGGAGTITSAVANTDKIRSDDSESGRKNEKYINLAANILAGASTITSGVATGFNVAALVNLNKVMDIAMECENALE